MNIKRVIPFLRISKMPDSLRFYVDGLGFQMQNQWINEGKLRWCSLALGAAELMIQEFWTDGRHFDHASHGPLGLGVSIVFICDDALAFHRAAAERGIAASEPFVGNGMWVTTIKDPDGYALDFESVTDVPEDTRYSDWKAR